MVPAQPRGAGGQGVSPTQFLPSGVISKPALQMHWKLPSVLTQRPFLHITPFMMHSSMSAGKAPKSGSRERQEQPQLDIPCEKPRQCPQTREFISKTPTWEIGIFSPFRAVGEPLEATLSGREKMNISKLGHCLCSLFPWWNSPFPSLVFGIPSPAAASWQNSPAGNAASTPTWPRTPLLSNEALPTEFCSWGGLCSSLDYHQKILRKAKAEETSGEIPSHTRPCWGPLTAFHP